MHRSVSVFCGPDAEHRALAGTVIMLTEEAADFEQALGALAVLRDAEELSDSCPSCGCDWKSEFDTHIEGCLYIAWGGKVGAR
jgi:hypothetical protein